MTRRVSRSAEAIRSAVDAALREYPYSLTDHDAGVDRVVDAVCDALNGLGREVTVPSADWLVRERERAARDAFIRQAFNGANHRDLAERFGVSERTVRRVVDTGRGKF